MTECKICQSPSHFIFSKTLLTKYEVSFFKCSYCEFIQTEEPYWLNEAYNPPLSPLDVTLASRQIRFSQLTEDVISNYFSCGGKFLDYGGGSGLFVRMMRDKGYSFYRQDKYADNIFAQYFDVVDLPSHERSFALLTCFEVLEHLADPLAEISKMFFLSQNIFFSTVLQPKVCLEDLKKWDYFGDLHGQHISFYTEKALKLIATKFNRNYYSDGNQFHLFTPIDIHDFSMKKTGNNNLIYRIKEIKNRIIKSSAFNLSFLNRKVQSETTSLAEQDYIYVQSKFRESHHNNG